MLFVRKNDERCGFIADRFRNLTRMPEFKDKKIKFTYTDIDIDPPLTVAYNVQLPSMTFVLDFKDKRAYAYDYAVEFDKFNDWLLKGMYKKSSIQLPIPSIASESEINKFMLYKELNTKYIVFVGQYVNKALEKLPGLNAIPPISLIYDATHSDLTMSKNRNQFILFVLCCIATFIGSIQVLRHVCCVKKVYVRKQKTH